jgi:hypothetical protein
MNDQYVVVKGCAGLGNRLMTIASALEYAQKTNRLLYVDWTDGFFAPRGSNAFNQLFDISSTLFTDNIEYKDSFTFYPAAAQKLPHDFCIYDFFQVRQPRNRYIRKCLKILNNVVEIKYQMWVGKDSSRLEFGQNLPLKLNENIVIYADYIPKFSKEYLIKNVKPEAKIAEKIEAYIRENNLEHDSAGLHIRATDKKPLKDFMTFCEKLDKFVQKKGIQRIYLATDNVEVENELKRRYGAMICVWPKFLPEISRGGYTILQKIVETKRLWLGWQKKALSTCLC